jgi:hypothetical protein
MAFPKTILGIAIGWEKRGKVRGVYGGEKGLTAHDACFRCRSILCVGRENNSSFLYCPKCLVKINKLE